MKKILKEACNQDFMETLTDVQQKGFKAGVIQNFEFTYELCWKYIQRWIRINLSIEQAEPRTRKDLFRIAAKKGLIQKPESWFEYTNARNETVHTYDEAKSEYVFKTATVFLDDAEFLLKQLQNHND